MKFKQIAERAELARKRHDMTLALEAVLQVWRNWR